MHQAAGGAAVSSARKEGKNMPKRLMPTRENLRRVHSASSPGEEVIAGVELMLYLIRAADVIRDTVYGALQAETDLTEGKFALLMTLFDAGVPVPLVELANRIGVAAPTTSIMVGRMLQAETPLVAKVHSREDARSALVKLTPAGESLLRSALPHHIANVAEFARSLSGEERETMIALLKKLVEDPHEQRDLHDPHDEHGQRAQCSRPGQGSRKP